MNRVVGARINDSLYSKLKEDDRTNTIIIREALAHYFLKDEKKNDVNSLISAVNNKKNEDKHKMIIKEIDEL